jgi:DNA-binding NtrC family response regulator
MKVLLVEDSASTRILLEAILAARGHEVTACADAEAALASYRPGEHALILLDWLLPGMDGLELCRHIRATPGGDRSVVLVITSRDQPEDLRAVLAAGADDYIAKPVDVESLNIRISVAEGTVRSLAERKRAESERAEAFRVLHKSREDLTSILDILVATTLLVDPDGRVTFVNRTGRDLLGLAPGGLDRPWQEIVPLTYEERETLRAMAALPPEQRSRVPAVLERGERGRVWVDVEVKDDPRDPRGKILFLHDHSDVHNLRLLLEEKVHFHDLVGRGAAMLRVFDLIRRVAQVDATVLVEGETGTGKELVARAIHFSGPRRTGPFVAVNTAGLTDSLLTSQLFGHRRGAFTGALSDHKGFFESADKGTIFLDEIGDVPPPIQTALLRVLQEREVLRVGDSLPRKVDARVIAATHHDLAADVEAGTFRSDLLYRIRVARILLPPLRERREDIPVLVKSFLAQVRAIGEHTVEDVSREAMRLLLDHSWPGNVRELRAAIEYAVINSSSSVLQPDDLPPEILSPLERGPGAAQTPAPPPPLDEAESRDQILAVLREVKGNRSEAAQRLGMSRSTFYRRLAELGLVAPTRR